MNKKGFTDLDVLEFLKIAILVVMIYIMVKALLSTGDSAGAKNVCDCACQLNNSVIKLG